VPHFLYPVKVYPIPYGKKIFCTPTLPDKPPEKKSGGTKNKKKKLLKNSP